MRMVGSIVMLPDFQGQLMRTQSLQKVLAMGLGLWLLLVSTALASSMTSHAIEHHHTQESHSQTWCDWMCKAGHAIHTPSVYLVQSFGVVTSRVRPYPTHYPSFFFFTADSRAPPAFSLLMCH
jgi:hypothetical protein